jgi:hypothetical protein
MNTTDLPAASERELKTPSRRHLDRLVRMQWVKVAVFLTAPIWFIPWVLIFATWCMWKSFSEDWDEKYGSSAS